MLLAIPMLLLLPACQVDLADVGHAPSSGTASAPAAAPPPAPGPNGEKVYQILYAGEFGDQARAAGQRARMLAWMHAVAFTPAQLESLLTLTRLARADQAESDAALSATDLAEGAALAPVYGDLVALYADGADVSDDALAAFAPRLEAARATAYGDEDPRAARYAVVSKSLWRARMWVKELPPKQQERLGECRFFLQRRLGPFTAPGDYGKWLGTAWNGADFASLQAAGRPVDEGQMDIGGLWAADDVERSPDAALSGLKVAVLLLFAMEEDGFVEAVEVRLGRREAGDYGAGG